MKHAKLSCLMQSWSSAGLDLDDSTSMRADCCHNLPCFFSGAGVSIDGDFESHLDSSPTVQTRRPITAPAWDHSPVAVNDAEVEAFNECVDEVNGVRRGTCGG